jgi:hypothetical protein
MTSPDSFCAATSSGSVIELRCRRKGGAGYVHRGALPAASAGHVKLA